MHLLNFETTLVSDGLAWSLYGIAQQEGLLYTSDGQGFTGRLPKPKDRQTALTLMLLFDKLIVHDFSPEPGAFRLPDLERDGIVEVVVASEPTLKTAPLKSSWIPSDIDPRGKPSVSLRRDFALLQSYKPLIVDRLMAVAQDFDSEMARTLGISRRRYYGEFIDFAIAYALGNDVALRNNLLEISLPDSLLQEIKTELFDFQKRKDCLSPTNATLVGALLFAHELGVIQELSSSRGLGVATRYYTRRGTDRLRESFSVDPSHVPKSFGLVRSVLQEEGHFFPEVRTIAEALKLRKNPHLRAFRERLREFHAELANGDPGALAQVRLEVQRAKRAMERTGKWNLALRWLTYISFPAGLVESLLSGLPVVGTSLAVMSVAGAALTNRSAKRNEWVLFGG